MLGQFDILANVLQIESANDDARDRVIAQKERQGMVWRQATGSKPLLDHHADAAIVGFADDLLVGAILKVILDHEHIDQGHGSAGAIDRLA
jgi:hypothetical protein